MAPSSLKVDAAISDEVCDASAQNSGPPLVLLPLSIPRRDAVATLRHDRELSRALKGIPVPVLFFCVFVAMLSQHIPTRVLYEQANSVSSVLDSKAEVASSTNATTMAFRSVATTGDAFDWLTDTFVPSVFITEDYNGKLLTGDKWGRIASFNKVLGAVMLQVTRAQIHPCNAAQFLLDLYPHCYDAANTTSDTLLISFDTNATEAADVITRLKNKGDWLDFSTLQLEVTVVAYNGEVQGYSVTKLTLDFHQGGYVEASSTTTPTISDPYKSQAAAVTLDVLVALCFCISLLGPLSRLVQWLQLPSLREKRAAIVNSDDKATLFFGLAPCVLVALFYVIWFSMAKLLYARQFRDNLARLVVSGKQFDANSDERSGLVAVTSSLEDVARIMIALRLASMGAVVALGLDILSQFRFHPRLSILTRTIANALHQFAAFFVVFAVIFVTFAVSGTVLFGDRVEQFATLSDSMESCVNMLFGNFDYTAILQSQQAPVGALYYWAYMVVVSLVLLNMMLAIVLDSYAEMTQQAAQSKYNISLMRTIRNVRFDWKLQVAQVQKEATTTATAATTTTITKWTNKKTAATATTATATRETASRSRSRKPVVVVFQGRIVPSVLETTLIGLDNADRKRVVTEDTLLDLFADAKLTRTQARDTIQFLLDGWNATSDDSDVDNGGAVVACEETQVSTTTKPATTAASSHHSQWEQQETDATTTATAATPLTAKETGDADRTAELARVLTRMEALEHKLDLLLTRSLAGP